MQSAYSCQKLKLSLDIFIPEDQKFLFYFSGDVVQIDLDKSYLFDPETAKKHAEETLSQDSRLEYQFIRHESYTGTGLPDLPTDFSLMTCPRSITDVSSRIGLGHIGPKVRKIVQQATFPILIPGTVFKPWQRIIVLYGGSKAAGKALQLAFTFQLRSKLPLQIISIGDHDTLETMLKDQGLLDQVNQHDWKVYSGSSLQKHLYEIPHDALVVLGAYGHGPIKALFGSSMELIQSQLPNPLLVVGPKYQPHG
ncbi:MAG: universal stress protein [Desulfuromusa sp.]|nr:universal stress protein [Desulfuromusa sp.]